MKRKLPSVNYCVDNAMREGFLEDNFGGVGEVIFLIKGYSFKHRS